MATGDIGTEAKRIIELNKEHNARLFAAYNPLTGEGSPISRARVYIHAGKFILVPSYLYATRFVQEIVAAGSLEKYSMNHGLEFNELYDFLNDLRIEYDFEFWCATCAKVKDKLTGRIVPFILRRAQLKLVKTLVDDLFAGKPVRIILLKARQWGGSTVVQLFMAWIQIFHRINWNSVIIAHQKDAARNIRAMYSRMADHHPVDVFPVRFRSFEGSQSNKVLLDRDCVVSIGSVLRPEALRSDDIKLVHCSEVGLWEDTPKRKADSVIQAVVSSVPNIAFTCVVIESTAKGIGNYFHNTWCEAEAGGNAYTPVFVAWWEIDMYRQKFRDEDEMLEFVKSMTPDEKERFNLGATLEGLNWYRNMRRTLPSDWQMKCEFPSTPREAFATTGRYVHNPADIEYMRRGCTEPKYVGEMVADATYGKQAIDGSLRFVSCDNGTLRLWALPDTSRVVSDRYVVSMDIGGRSDDADWTVISVIDRYMLSAGGVEECIGTYRFHLDQDLAVWKAVQLARFFCNALLVVEFNSLDTKTTEGDHTYTILDEIVNEYDNIYFRDDPTKVRAGLPPHYGFHTNRATKRDLITQMNKRLRERLYIENDKMAVDEIEWFEQKVDKDQFGAIDGKHDDIYMSRAIGLKVSSKMPLPVERVQTQEQPYRSHDTAVRSQSSI